MAFSINEPPGSPGNPLPFTLESVEPSSAAIGGADFTLHVHGTDFVSGMQIFFAGHLERTDFVSDTEITTVVKPSLWQAPADVEVSVSAFGFMPPPLTFSFTDGAARGRSKVAYDDSDEEEADWVEDKHGKRHPSTHKRKK